MTINGKIEQQNTQPIYTSLLYLKQAVNYRLQDRVVDELIKFISHFEVTSNCQLRQLKGGRRILIGTNCVIGNHSEPSANHTEGYKCRHIYVEVSVFAFLC